MKNMHGKFAWYLPAGAEQRALACLSEAWNLSERAPDAWPGWDLRRVPVALYKRDGTFLLAGHPRPPRGAREVFWPGGVAGPPVYRVSGLPSMVTVGAVAVPYRGAVTAFIPVEWSGRSAEEAREFVTLIWREGFHAHLHTAGKAGVIALSLPTPYPDDHHVNNALGNIEGRLLLEARTTPDGELPRLALAFALIRRERRAQLDDALIDYERAVEYYSGLATYVCLRALEAAGADYEPCPPFQRLAGESGFPMAGGWLDEKHRAELAVVNRRGRGAVRRRFFHTGAELALLLDRFHPGWKARIHQPDVWLDTLLEEKVTFDGGVGDDAIIAEAEHRYDYVSLLEEERANAREMRERRQQLLQSILSGNGTMFIFDVSQLRLTDIRLDHDGLEAVNERLQVHTGAAFFQYGPATTLYFHGVPVVEDRESGLLEVRIPDRRLRISGDDSPFRLVKPAEFTEGFELNAGGVRVRARQGIIQPIDGAIYVKITR